MLTGIQLGKAIAAALKLKKVSQANIAREFGIKAPSVSGWIRTGRISKPHFERLREYVSDVVEPDHWGTSSSVRERRPQPYHKPLSDQELWLITAFRKANKDTRAAMLALARIVIPENPTRPQRRTGT